MNFGFLACKITNISIPSEEKIRKCLWAQRFPKGPRWLTYYLRHEDPMLTRIDRKTFLFPRPVAP